MLQKQNTKLTREERKVSAAIERGDYVKLPPAALKKEMDFFTRAARNTVAIIDWEKVGANLGPLSKTISIRLPEELLRTLKTEASTRNIPYQSYIKTILADAVAEKKPARYQPKK